MACDTSSLLPLLSPGSTIDSSPAQPLRWSEYAAPQPGSVVHPATPEDVQAIVKWANERHIPFLAQSGGNGWATTFKLQHDGIIIHLDLLRSVTFNPAGTEATIGGGALISDVVAAAAAKQSLTLTGICNCVGALGALLGGGFSNLMGQYGLAIDDLLSLAVVKADGRAVTVTPADPDLWWAMRGAGPNFGIVTSAVLRAHPVAEKSDLTAWTGPLTFDPAKLEAVVDAIQNLELSPEMSLSLHFINAGRPVVLTTLFYHGSAAAGRAAFAPLFDIGPLAEQLAELPYESWNNGSNIACMKGGRRPVWAAGLAHLDAAAWRNVYDIWAELIAQPGAERSSMLCNIQPTAKARALPDASSAYPFRSTVRFHAGLTVAYRDAAFDATAQRYGEKVRAMWQATDGLARRSTYINNAHGDETLETVYGDSLERLRTIKREHDPEGRFNEWFPLS
ncbi:hypothetical protein BDV95DRAFT_521567 [Massariosphaeria phaeospora]|uniref:FAD-binding PCMH-type domain-containing protein n=1 Tax=Massariosphaeria phaeospora TaxID=100035 RepID=A0A7C8M5G6_9PLEO|nr:hypothetical protein BDV95DRAFT_521567 [Massariosphaeria phaeospora]